MVCEKDRCVALAAGLSFQINHPLVFQAHLSWVPQKAALGASRLHQYGWLDYKCPRLVNARAGTSPWQDFCSCENRIGFMTGVTGNSTKAPSTRCHAAPPPRRGWWPEGSSEARERCSVGLLSCFCFHAPPDEMLLAGSFSERRFTWQTSLTFPQVAHAS